MTSLIFFCSSVAFSESLGNQWWEGLSLALLCVIFYFSSNLAKAYKEEKSNNECIVCEEMMMIYKESHLRNGHTVDLQSWQMYPKCFERISGSVLTASPSKFGGDEQDREI